MLPIIFVIPDVNSFVSGGNLYNQCLLDALHQRSDISVTYLTIEEVPKDLAVLGKGMFFIDSLYLQDFAPKRDKEQFFYLIVHHLPSMYPDHQEEQLIRAEERQLKEYDGFLVTSQLTASYLTAKKVVAPKLVLPPIPNIFVPIPTQRPATPIRAIIVANLLPRKGILPFLKILENCLGRFDEHFTIEVIGESSLDESYAAACHQILANNVELTKRVRMIGTRAPIAVQQAYQQANLFISVSAFETFGMALQEAVLFGLPILAIKGGNIATHIEEGINGYIFDTIDLLVDKLLSLTQSPREMGQLLQRSISYKEHYAANTWEQHAAQLIRHII